MWLVRLQLISLVGCLALLARRLIQLLTMSFNMVKAAQKVETASPRIKQAADGCEKAVQLAEMIESGKFDAPDNGGEAASV